MADKPDLEHLAKRYLDLWQDQLAGMASDVDIQETIARTIELMNASGAAFASMAQSAMEDGSLAETFAKTAEGITPNRPGCEDNDRHEKPSQEKAGDKSGARASPGTKAPATPPSAANPDINELTSRIAALEERIAALEAGAKKRSRKPRKRP